jgi:hypothetical protein
MWNTHETMLNTSKRFRVRAAKGRLPGITGFVLIREDGTGIKSQLILPNLQRLKGLLSNVRDNTVLRHTRQWPDHQRAMVGILPLIFVYKLPLSARSGQTNCAASSSLLIADGHRSHLSLNSALLFR